MLRTPWKIVLRSERLTITCDYSLRDFRCYLPSFAIHVHGFRVQLHLNVREIDCGAIRAQAGWPLCGRY